jgi:oxepin-CoA hydrolase/3-oxo-5,6-dehydrosuberyl-CoA semialdehyde dehydrogenase
MTKILQNYCLDEWFATATPNHDLHSAVTGELVARTGTNGIDFAAMLRHAREVGSPALRALTFHQRAGGG